MSNIRTSVPFPYTHLSSASKYCTDNKFYKEDFLMSKDVKTPMLDDLEKGAWPSFVKEIKKAAKTSNTAHDLLGILERSYRDKVTHWKHGGIVGVLGYGGGVIGRYCDLPQEFPGVAHFHTVRINPPSGFFYTSHALKEMCDI